MMTITFVIGISLLLQIATILYALKLVAVTGWKKAWTLLAIGILTMGVRRFMTFVNLVSGDTIHQPEMSYELIGLAGSAIMLAGVIFIEPIFVSIKRTESALRESEMQLFHILERVPVGIFIISRDGRPYYANKIAIDLLGKGIDKTTTSDQSAETYQVYIAGTEERYPVESMPIVKALSGETTRISDMEIRRNGRSIIIESVGAPLSDEHGTVHYAVAAFNDITERKRSEQEREQLIMKLQDALSQIRTLSGMLPICASCKKVRDDQGYWNQIEVFISKHSAAEFSHGICPECAQKLYPDFFKKT